jgi:hypothetical protein
MNERKRRNKTRELVVQFTLTEAGPVPPERLKDGLRVLVTWLARMSGKPDIQAAKHSRN